MSRLERTRVGNFSITESLPDHQITVATIQERIRPAVEIVAGLPAFECSADDLVYLGCGCQIRIDRTRLREAKGCHSRRPGGADQSRFLGSSALAEMEDLQLKRRTVFVAAATG